MTNIGEHPNSIHFCADGVETWCPVVGFEDYYEVSDKGRVGSLAREVSHPRSGLLHIKARLLKPIIAHTTGYPRVTLNRDGVGSYHHVHRLVTAAFIGPLPEGWHTRHINGNPIDNRLENLTYGTPSENQQDRLRHGTHHNANKTHCKWGHEFTEDNIYRPGDGGRRCRECTRARQKGVSA